MPVFAIAQFHPDPSPAENLRLLDDLAGRAAAGGADMLLAPEGASVRFLDDADAPVRTAEPLDGPFVTGLCALSRRYGITIAAGTFTSNGAGGRVQNTLVVAQQGAVVAAYRKVHLYDAFSFVESERIAPGSDVPPVIDIGGVRVGFATCYDLRFPELFRLMVADGAEVIALASAWVAGPVKEEHWATLLKARAIENTCYVLAADQVGPKGIGRSSAYDPMGLALADLGTADGALGFVSVLPERLAQVRAVLPSNSHRRFAVDRIVRDPAELPGA